MVEASLERNAPLRDLSFELLLWSLRRSLLILLFEPSAVFLLATPAPGWRLMYRQALFQGAITMSNRLLSALAATLIATNAFAAEPAAPIVLKASHLFDSKTGKLMEGATIVIQDDKI